MDIENFGNLTNFDGGSDTSEDDSLDIFSLETLIDLTNSGDRSIEFTVTREAAFNNTVDFYPVVDADGGVIDPDTGDVIVPGEAGYADVAIDSRLGADISTENGVTSQFTENFSGGAYYAPLIAVERDFSTFADSDASNDPVVYFTYEEANIDGFDHAISLTENQFGFEDLPNGGDEDFDDIVLDFELVVDELSEEESSEPVDETPVEEEPVDETSMEEPETEESIEEPVDEALEEEPETEEAVEEEPVDETSMEESETEDPIMEVPEGNGLISGLKFNDSNNSGVRDSELVQGEDPDVVFVIDVSGSTVLNSFLGTIDVGDLNNDRAENEVLDAEIAGFTALNQQLIDQGLGDIDIGVVAFSGSAQTIITTTPNTDEDGNGTSDVVDSLSELRGFGGTNFEAALQSGESVFDFFETEPGNGNLIFISDGDPDPANQIYNDEVTSLIDRGVNLSAFGAGEGADLSNLQIIDPDAQIFTSTDQLLNVFGDLNSDADGDGVPDGGESQSTLEEVVSGVTVYIDLNENGTLDDDEPSQVTDENGEYVFEGLAAGTYTLREVVPAGFTSTTGEVTIALGEGETIENVDFGNISDEELAMLNVEPDM